MSKVFFDVGISVDGLFAGPNPGPCNPLGDGGVAIYAWMFGQKGFQQNLGRGDNGETGEDDRIVASIFCRSGAHIMGKRMFEEERHRA